MRRALASAMTIGVVALAAACLEYSPHELPTSSRDRDLHRKALERLLARTPPEPLRFAVVGDTQFFFDEAEEVIDALRGRDDLAFVVQIGDFTHLGLWREFELMADVFRRLEVPWFVTIGIHDFLGNGEVIYRRMFGPTELAFDYGRVRFVLFDSNSRERGFDGTVPDLAWLAAQLVPGPDHDAVVLLSHIWPWSDDFDPALREPYLALVRDAGVALSLHGHEHGFQARESDGVQFYVADDLQKRGYLLVTRRPDGAFEVERVPF